MKSYIKSFLAVIPFVICLSSSLEAITYEQLKEWHIRSLPVQTTARKRGLLGAVYDILAQKEKQAEVKHLEIDQAFYKEMELFVGDGKRADINIMASIDRTESIVGAIMLRKMTSTLSANVDPDVFAARQMLITKLVENPDLFDRVAALCAQWAKSEKRFLSNWDNAGINQKDIDKHYYNWFPSLNDNPLALTLGEYARLIEPHVKAAAISIGLITLGKYIWSLPCEGSSRTHRDTIYDTVSAFPGFIMDRANPKYGWHILKKIWHQENPFIRTQGQMASQDELFKILTGITQLGFAPFNLYENSKSKRSTEENLAILQKQLGGFADFIHTTAEVKKLADEYPELHKGISSVQQVHTAFENKEEIVPLVRLLHEPIFQRPYNFSYFRDSGTILATHKGVQEKKEKFVEAIEMLGELDSCLSMAKLIKDEQAAGYCLAEVKDMKEPYIHMKNFWLPLLDSSKAITNDVQLGGEGKPQQIIITGSNTGGKSTVGLKAPLVALYLAHSLGIAPASKCITSRFDTFASYLHVNDDTAIGDSAFQAELRRVKDMLTTIRSLKEGQKAFIVIDELFRGTASEPAEFGAYKVAEYLSKQPNAMSIIATHAKKLTHLEKETGRSINMKIDVKKDEQGNLVRPHKLEPGISDNNIAIELMKRDLDGIGFN